MNIRSSVAATALLGSALFWQTAQAQLQTLPPWPSAVIIAETPGAANPANPVYPPAPPGAYAYPPAAYGYPPPPGAQPPAEPMGYGSSMAPGFRPTTPQTLDFGNSRPSEENYR